MEVRQTYTVDISKELVILSKGCHSHKVTGAILFISASEISTGQKLMYVR